MKTAIYLNEGTTQIVLTPENDWEKSILKMLESSPSIKTFWGSFYECQGGWYRESKPEYKDGLMFRIEKQSEVLHD